MSKVYINNTEARSRHFLMPPRNASAAIRTIGPGISVWDPETWAAIADDPEIQQAIEDEVLVVMPTGAAYPLADVPAKKAIKNFVEQCFDTVLLGNWMKSEKRVAVKEAIEAQLAKLALPTQPDIKNPGVASPQGKAAR